MKALKTITATLPILALSLSAAAQDDRRELERLFPREAPIQTGGPGLTRLPLPVEVLRESRGDLADLRIFDERGEEVPFLIDSGVRPVEPAPPQTETIAARAISLSTSETARSGGLGPVVRETFVIVGPDHPSAAGAWDLVVVTPRTHFVRHVEVFDGVAGVDRIAGGAVFRLPSPAQEQLRVRLPASLPPMLRVVVEGKDFGLEPAFQFESARTRETPEILEVPLLELGRRREGERTIVELARPLGIVPSRLRLETGTTTFDRLVSVRDASAAGEARALGAAMIFRVPELAVDERIVSIAAPRGDRLELTIDDGSSPALEALSVTALVERPALVFSATRPGATPPGELVLRFGGGRAHAPGYDLERFAGTELGRRILVGGTAREARLGEIRDNPRFDPRPALDYAMRPGASIDPRRFTHHRELRVDAAPEGLSRLRLGALELAAAREDLGDVRVVDDRNRAWPFLLQREGVTADTPVTLAAPVRDGGWSKYRIELPASQVAASALVLDPRGSFVDRAYRVVGRIELPERRRARARPGDDEVVLGEGRLIRRPGETSPLRLPLAGHRVIAITLEVEDGDDPALAFASSVLDLPSADLFLVAPPGIYRLVAGDARAPAANHEIARARELVLTVRAEPIVPTGELVPNPRYLPRDDGALNTVLLWIAIILAVVVLAFLTLRTARAEPPEPPSAAPPQTPGAPPAADPPPTPPAAEPAPAPVAP